MRGCWGLALTLAAMAGSARVSQAQRARLTVTGGPLTFPTPTDADFQNGFIDTPTGLAYTVRPANVAGQTSTLSIRSASADLGNGKPLSDLLWRRADLGVWTAITTSDATVESQPGRPTFSNAILFRTLLSWTATAPATYRANLVVTLTVTAP